MQMTKSLVYYHASGLERRDTGEIIRHHRILAKISRPEVAEAFYASCPEKLLNQLLEDELITETQASLAKNIPVSIDICVEADSGGHTDRGWLWFCCPLFSV
jgi:trans-AT polyketide synthase/acyltransferase/oxidoreductase domain-containing protein